MKNILLLLIFLVGLQHANAECAISGITYYPKQRSISQHAMFIIEGYSYSQELINSFAEDRKAYLENDDGHRVYLVLQEILVGQMNLTQAIFKPAETLKLDKKYFLKFTQSADQEDYTNLTRYTNDYKEKEPVAWKVTTNETEDLDKHLNLKFEKTKVEFYGCGPAAYALFQPQHAKPSAVWYKTEVYDEKTKTSTTFLITAQEGMLRVGHDMCSGGFTFSKEGTYKVRFTPMNLDGKALKTTAWQSFESPFTSAENPWGFSP